MIKKMYVKPTQTIIEVSSLNMLCGSLVISNEEVDTEGRARVSEDSNNNWSNRTWDNW